MLTITTGVNNQRQAKQLYPSRQPPHPKPVISNPWEHAYKIVSNALSGIVNWDNQRSETEREKDVKRWKKEKLERENKVEVPVKSRTHIYLEKIINNIPYGLADDNVTGSLVESYKNFKEEAYPEIISLDDLIYLNQIDYPKRAPVTLKVLQNIIDHYTDADITSNEKKNSEINENHLGTSRMLVEDIQAIKNIRKSDSHRSPRNLRFDQASEDEQAHVVYIMSTILTEESSQDETLVNALKDSILKVADMLPKGNLTDEQWEKVKPQIATTPGIIPISQDQTTKSGNLLNKVKNILRITNPEEFEPHHQNQLEPDPISLRSQNSDKPIFFIDGGILIKRDIY